MAPHASPHQSDVVVPPHSRRRGCLVTVGVLVVVAAGLALDIRLTERAWKRGAVDELLGVLLASELDAPTAEQVEVVLALGPSPPQGWKGGRAPVTPRYTLGWEGPHLIDRGDLRADEGGAALPARVALPPGDFVWILDDATGVRAGGPLPSADGAVVMGCGSTVWIHPVGAGGSTRATRNQEPW